MTQPRFLTEDWTYEHGNSDQHHIHDANGLVVASTADRMDKHMKGCCSAKNGDEDAANAALFSLAPAMFRLLKEEADSNIGSGWHTKVRKLVARIDEVVRE